MSEHFTLDELTRSETAARLGIPNLPSELHLLNLTSFLMPGLESVRALLKQPILVTSGYRSLALNAHVPGSSSTSAHTKGYAADFVCPKFGSAWDVCQKLSMSDIAFDQLIYEYGAWTHISFDPRQRGLIMSKHAGQPYRDGLHKE
jgi:zinc D-Ala-D-Ala carboxypeptidase